jgi:hypothetical protein
VTAPEPLGHQHLDRLAQQFGAGIAKDALGLGVDHLDAARNADHHHRIGCGLDHLPKPVVIGAGSIALSMTSTLRGNGM